MVVALSGGCTFSGPDIHAVCAVETRNHAHVATLLRALKKGGFPLVMTK